MRRGLGRRSTTTGEGRRSTTTGEGIEEDKAMRVGRITGGSHEASKIGVALLTLLSYLTRAMSAGECADGLDGSCTAAAKPSDEGWGFFIAMGVLLAMTSQRSQISKI